MIFIDIALGLLLTAAVAAVWRIATGPSAADRAIAADLVFFAFIAAVALLAVRIDEPLFLEVTVIATLVGFLATISLARLIDRSSR
jgi:multicomponent Na+:H+ antiporter subunit F